MPTITTYLNEGGKNDPKEVRKLQEFLRDHEKMSLEVSGIFDAATTRAVKAFQEKYRKDILAPWGIATSTGAVSVTTPRKISNLICGVATPLSAVDLSTITRIKSKFAQAPVILPVQPIAVQVSNPSLVISTTPASTTEVLAVLPKPTVPDSNARKFFNGMSAVALSIKDSLDNFLGRLFRTSKQ